MIYKISPDPSLLKRGKKGELCQREGGEKSQKCVFRSKVAIDSDRNWPLIPVESGHRFRLIPATFFLFPESGLS